MMKTSRRFELEEAVRAFVKPGASIYLNTDATAAVRSLIRVFDGTAPGLTVQCLRAGASHAGELLETGLVRKLIASSFGTQYPTFRPSPLLRRAYAGGAVQFEFWSLFSLVQRLTAGALGLPFLTTRTLKGSSMAKDNPDYAEIENPFSGGTISIVRALQPDVCFIRALASDDQGNSMVCPPFEDDLWPTRAARDGCIVLAENIVSEQFMKEQARLVNLPAFNVLAVCHVPYASHPQGFESGQNLGLEIERYEMDIESYTDYERATRDSLTFRQWLDENILSPDSHAGYLAKVRKRSGFPWPSKQDSLVDACVATHESLVDQGVTACGLLIAELVQKRGYRKLLAGVGHAQGAAKLAYQLLRASTHELTLIEGIGRVGFKPSSVEGKFSHDASMLTGTSDVYGTMVGGNSQDCVALLGAAQIDRQGNINSTFSGGKLLVGSGGLNDAVTLAACSVVLMRSDPTRMVENVEYITAPGAKVEFLVNEDAIFQKNKAGVFEILRWFLSEPNELKQQALARVQASCPWPLALAQGACGLHVATWRAGAWQSNIVIQPVPYQ